MPGAQVKGISGPRVHDNLWNDDTMMIGQFQTTERTGSFDMRRIALTLVVACLLAGVARAQNSPQVVDVRTVQATEGVHPGSTLKVAAVARIAPGFHINDHKPTLDYLIPTEWKLESTKQVSVDKVVYPKGQLKKFAFSDMQLSVYEGTMAVGALLKVPRATRPGTYALRGQFYYQACNDHACLPPKRVPLTLVVKVVRRSTPLKRLNAGVFDGIQFD
jgi:hypothetical protein